jgi:hypothetical protein
MTWTFDEEETLDNFAHSGLVNLTTNAVSIYGVVCFGSEEAPNSSHGGYLTPIASDAVEGARDANERIAAMEGVTPEEACHYVPVSFGIPVAQLLALASVVTNVIETERREEGE